MRVSYLKLNYKNNLSAKRLNFVYKFLTRHQDVAQAVCGKKNCFYLKLQVRKRYSLKTCTFDYKEVHPVMKKITKKLYKEKHTKLEKLKLEEKAKSSKISSMKTMGSFRDLDDIMKVPKCRKTS